MTKIFSRDYLKRTLNLPEDAIEDEIYDTRRWSIDHRIIFRDTDGRHYETFYAVGATENQDEGPWEHESTVECYPVEAREVTVTKWVRV